jgi:AIPR protein
MSFIHVQQIKAHLEKNFSPLVDLSDCLTANAQQKEATALTRGLAAFAVASLNDLTPEEGCRTVTDGPGDNGIDAIYYNEDRRSLYLVQAKWHSDGHGSIDRGDTQKFITGFRDLLNERFDRFSEKARLRQPDVERAIFDSEAESEVVLVLAYSGQEEVAEECQRDIDDLLEEMNDPSELVQLRVLRQQNIHNFIAQGTVGSPIDLQVSLSNWGQVKDPHFAVFGLVAVQEVAEWFKNHQSRLFSPNLRYFLGSTEVNNAILETLKTQPSLFWYFNNGITALCDSVDKTLHGGNNRDFGVFKCSNVSVVNGAQTVGAIAAAVEKHPEETAGAYVSIRFISLPSGDTGLTTSITRCTNTQNRIERRDFVALDELQEQLRRQLQIDGIEYAYKAGAQAPKDRPGFDLQEATVALACAQDDSAYAVQAKREIGKLWEDITKAPYKALFNASVDGKLLWDLVQILRVVDATLGIEAKAVKGRDRMHVVHGNRLIAWFVFHRHGKKFTAPKQVETLSKETITKVKNAADALYPDAYLASLYKNNSKCSNIASSLS